MTRLKKILRFLLKSTIVLLVLAVVGFWTIRYLVWQDNIQIYYHEINLDDGPYVFRANDSTLRVMNIHNVPMKETPSGFLDTFRAAWTQELPAQYETSESTIDLTDRDAARLTIEALGISFDPDEVLEIPGAVFEAERVAAMGDVHGNYKHLTALLKNGNIVDDALNWSWAEGHLVFTGDVFDEGPGVTECLWLIYKLERQARAAGGMVHYLLGNHELMVLSGTSESRFRGRKYSNIERELGINYGVFLYGPDTVLGRWLRTRNTVVKINDTLFVHGGLSENVVDRGLTIEALNRYGRLLASGVDPSDLNAQDREMLGLLDSYWGPYQYRGYVGFRGIVGDVASKLSDKTDELSQDIRPQEIMTKVMGFYGTRRAVVGHEHVGTIQLLREGTVVAINVPNPRSDVIDEKSNTQMLVIEGNELYRLRISGERESLSKPPASAR